jgi:hypothetical protein
MCLGHGQLYLYLTLPVLLSINHRNVQSSFIIHRDLFGAAGVWESLLFENVVGNDCYKYTKQKFDV